MLRLNFLWIIAISVLFSACSSKKYFEPEHTVEPSVTVNETKSTILAITEDGATLQNHTFISKDGVSDIVLDKDFEFLNNVEGVILASNKTGKLYVNVKGSIKYYNFSKRVISASIFGNYIALLFLDNSIAIYDTVSKNILFKEYYTTSVLNDTKIANPIFLSSVVLFPTLDGKIIVVDFKKNMVVKTINIDPKGKINNIIYFKAIKDTLIAATPTKLFTFIDGKPNIKDLNIKGVVANKKNIFVATLEGELIKYDHYLKLLKTKKFKFAKFYALGYAKYLYALESQGYIIRVDSSLNDEKIIDFPFDKENEAMIIDDKLYYDDKYILLK
jgi:hypothetical protein